MKQLPLGSAGRGLPGEYTERDSEVLVFDAMVDGHGALLFTSSRAGYKPSGCRSLPPRSCSLNRKLSQQ